MEIKVDEKEVQQAINSQMTKAIDGALGSYNVRNALAKKFTEQIAGGVIGQAIETALASVDKDALVKALAAEIQKATTGAVCNLLYEGMAELILSIRKIPEYDHKVRAEAKAKIMADLRRTNP